MIQRLFALVLMFVPALCLAEGAPAPMPVETPWAALISFLGLCVVIALWTVWAIFFKKDGGNQPGKD